MGTDGDSRAASALALIGALHREVHPRTAHIVRAEDHIERDLGMDSLTRAELLLRLERAFDLRVPVDEFASIETVGDLLRLLAHAPRRMGAAPVEVRAIAHDVDAGVPDLCTTLSDVLAWHVTAHPQQIHALMLGEDESERQITYEALWLEAGLVSNALTHEGVTPGDTVAIMLPTSSTYLSVFFGILLAGAIPVPMYPPARHAQLTEHIRRHIGILNNAQSTFLVTLPEAKGVAGMLKARVASLRGILIGESLLAAAAHVSPVARRADDLALLQYTSGSTGQPKGVMLTHANLLANIRAMGEVTQVSSSDLYVSWLPMYHDMGLIASWLASLYYGIPIVLMSPLTFLARPHRWLRAIARHGGTISGAPNFAYELCATRVDETDLEGLDLSGWRIAYNGAEPVNPRTLERFSVRFARYGFRPEALTPVYGLAECSVGLTCPAPGRGPQVDRVQRDPFQRQGLALPAEVADASALAFVSCGPVLPGHELRVVDEEGQPLAERRQGRLQFRGPSATMGYYRDAPRTRELIRDGWLDTGDYAYLVQGHLHVTGRAKDLIIRAGRNIHPAELEQAAGEIPGIRKGCVVAFGSPDPASGTERLVVMAEARDPAPAGRSVLRERVDACVLDVLGMPADEVIIVAPHTVLKTSSGKIRRAACRELYERGALRVRAPPGWVQWSQLEIEAALARTRRLLTRLLHGLYGTYAWSVFTPLAASTWFALLVIPGHRARWRIARGTTRLGFRLCGMPLRIVEVSRIPRGGRYLVAANHASYLDGLLLTALWPEPLAFVAKQELASVPVVGSLLRRLGALFVHRFETRQALLDVGKLQRAATEGKPLAFFPEGTFRRDPGLLAFHLGGFGVALAAGLPVLPVVLRGTRSALPADTWWPRRTHLEVIALPAVIAEGTGWDATLALRAQVRHAILERCGEADLN